MRLPCIVSCAALLSVTALAQSASQVGTPLDLPSYVYSGPVSAVAPPATSGSLLGAVQLAVKLQDPPLVVAVGANAKQNGIAMSAAQQRSYLAYLKQKQDAVMSQVRSLGGVELGRVSKGHNAVLITVDASRIAALRGISGVAAVRPLVEAQISADPATEAYIGATAVQNAGITGAGIRVAMLDTGIDYTHLNLGGSGKLDDYKAAAVVGKSDTPPPALFPTQKVIGGYDFTGDSWQPSCQNTTCPLAPDPNPIDLNGHGTATADTLGGKSLDGTHVGTAPGVQLYAVKVCSSVSTSCSGVAMLEGVDFALDPTNSGTLNNAVDIISMSIGGDFGQREDDLGEAFTDVVSFGVVSVVSAGNSGDIPYVIGHPAATPEVIALAATTAVNATGIPLVINSPAGVAGTYRNTATLSFAPVSAAVTGDVVFVGRGCPAGSISATSPDDPYLANPSGKIALIDRGACSVSLKIDRAAKNGAVAVLIGLVASGDAVSFSNGGGSTFVPSLVITQATSTAVKAALSASAVNATISPDNTYSLAGNVASYSSRGPNYSYNMLKPDLSAPGTVTVAAAGTGDGQISESGTSFACPLAGGAAALLLSKNRSLAPLDIKAILMGTSEPLVYNNSATQPGYLAPLSRIGAGELRVDRSVAASTSAWDASDPLAVSLSFGTYRLNVSQTFRKKVVIRNYSDNARTYSITNTYRDAPNTTGVTITAPASIVVPASGSANFNVTLTVKPVNLPTWTLNGGSNGSNGELLNTVEYAGYLTFAADSEVVHLPWHVLPHKAANVSPAAGALALGGTPGTLTLNNPAGATSGLVGVFSLTGTGVQFPASALSAPGSDNAVINLQYVGVRLICTASCSTNSPVLAVSFAVNTFGQRSLPDVPAEFDIGIDVDNDGVADLVIFNEDIGYVSTGTNSGQNGVFVYDVAANKATGPYFYISADLDSANAILTAPLSALQTAAGLKLTISTPFTFTVSAFDNYFTGNRTDFIGPMQYELDMPRFYAGTSSLLVPPDASQPITIFPNNAANPFLTGPYNGNSPSQTGLLLMYTDGKTGQEASVVTVTP